MSQAQESAQLKEYLVITECGRRFAWMAIDTDALFRERKYYHYTPLLIRPMSEYEAEVEKQDQQIIFNAEIQKDIERKVS